MTPEVSNLCALLSDTGERRNHAVAVLGMLLERSSRPRMTEEYYDDFVGAKLTGLRLSVAEQKEVLSRADAVLRASIQDPCLPVLFGSANPVVALPMLLLLMEDLWSQFTDEVRAECLVALRDLLCYTAGRPRRELLRMVVEHNPRGNIAAALRSPYERLAEFAAILLADVDRFLNDGDEPPIRSANDRS